MADLWPWLIGLGLVVAVAVILYWQLVVAEGAYLGAPLVTLMYDLAAERYNRIKGFDPAWEDWTVGAPLARLQPYGPVLDVATGTGRVPLTLLRQPNYRGRIIGLDRSARMLNIARRDTAAHQARVRWVQADARALPFADDSVPLAVSLESLEFLPDPEQGLAELVRVLQPALSPDPSTGWLLTTHRIGWEARLMPGKTWSREKLQAILWQLSLSQIRIQAWQQIYNLVWAQKVVQASKPPTVINAP